MWKYYKRNQQPLSYTFMWVLDENVKFPKSNIFRNKKQNKQRNKHSVIDAKHLVQLGSSGSLFWNVITPCWCKSTGMANCCTTQNYQNQIKQTQNLRQRGIIHHY